jgi:hypothetical protein
MLISSDDLYFVPRKIKYRKYNNDKHIPYFGPREPRNGNTEFVGINTFTTPVSMYVQGSIPWYRRRSTYYYILTGLSALACYVWRQA